ncbi:MAG: hypothetical protein ACREDI_08150, partial [Roseiarcus sp.]
LYFGDEEEPITTLKKLNLPVPLSTIRIGKGAVGDPESSVAQRYDGKPGTLYLIRPDQHVAARWRHADPAILRAALHRVLAFQE